MSARKSNTQSRVEHELLASPLVSRSPSPVSEADEESTGEISDVELPSEEEDPGADATEVAEVVAISSDESGPEDASEEEEADEGTETVSPEVSSDEDDVARRAARDRMIFRRLSRATAGLGRICLGQMPPSGKPKKWARILEARAVTVRQWEARRAARRLRDAEAEEAALAAAVGSAAAVGNAAAATATTCADATTTATTTLTITTTIVAAEAAGVAPATSAGRASAADHRGGGAAVASADGHVDVARARGGSRGGHRSHRVAAPTAAEPARSEGQVDETRRGDGRSRGAGGDDRGGTRGPGGAGVGAMGVANTAGDVAGHGATPEAGAADFVPGVASPTGEADAAETAVGGRGTVGGGSGGGLAGAGGRRGAATAREAEEGQVGQARAGGGTALPSQGSRGPGAGV
ncbi:homeotic protein female sterile-like [Drosophila gunungcola]|uniref:homeotic protein female sterile-like n=1 Tax=Drosophila gunungcola TaxID=103775 RepID=UPI0022DEE533|nr:homeotic protein female sterile-like [Drosophila gunungcola]